MNWDEIPSSQSLKELIQQQLNFILPSVHGYSMVTLGQLSACFDYESADVATTLHLGTNTEADVFSHLHQLPLASDDIDAIFAPLVIEQCEFPHQLLREIVRSLRPSGKLILVLFNPFSIWGVYKIILGTQQRKPWNLSFYRTGTIKEWMSLLGLEVTVEHGLFAHLPGTESSSQKLDSKVYSQFGAIKFIVAEKKIKTLTPLRPVWKKAKIVNTGIIEPTPKQISNFKNR